MTRRRATGRRMFLRDTAVAIGAMAAPGLGAVRGRSAAGGVPPSERITMGFIGVGTQGSGHLAGGAWTYLTGGYLGRDDVQVIAVCDLKQDRLDRAKGIVEERYAARTKAGAFSGCAAYGDFRALLARDDIDAVLIATNPPHLHALMTIMAAKAGKDVYCEKPTAGTIHESRAMVEAVRRYGRVFQAGTQQRSEYEGRFLRATELVRNGAVGTLEAVYTMCGPDAGGPLGAVPPGSVPDGSAADLIGTGTFMAASGGHPNWQQHHFDCAQWGIDGDRTGPVEIFKADDTVVLRYASGVEMRCARHPDAPNISGGVVFVGSKGKIFVGRESLSADPPGILETPIGPEGVRVASSTSHSGNFLHCVRTRQLPVCDVETAHRSMSAILLAGIGQRLNRRLEWDPARERFVNDDEADRMLHVVTRPPWRI